VSGGMSPASRSSRDWATVHVQTHTHFNNLTTPSGGVHPIRTPDQVHYGQADDIHAARQIILDRAFKDDPERFVNKPPTPPAKPTAVWINPPLKHASQESLN
jgi:hypothetical protein